MDMMAEPGEASLPLGRDASAATAPDAALREAACHLADGGPEALQEIWDLCARDLYGLALWRTGSPVDAQDVVQDVFVHLARSPTRLGQALRPRAYLLAMAHRAATDLLRRRRRRPGSDAPCEWIVPPGDPARAADAERAARLLGRLSPKQRAAVYLRIFAGLSFAEVGRVTGVPTFTAASRYRLALRRLRLWMGVAS
jgi:RNA polymerase sigma-70 factor (ECF subfamily)